MKRFVVFLVAVLAVFTFIRDFSGEASGKGMSPAPVIKAEILP